MTMLLLDAAMVRRVYPMSEAVDVMRDALRAFSDGRVVQPLRHMVRAPHGDVLAVMPAYVGGDASRHSGFGLKMITIKPDNPGRGLPAHVGLVLVFDPDTGAPRALVDGAAITAIRTAAVSAVATDLLAAPDAGTLAILGAGVQARAHLEAMLTVRRPGTVRVWSRRPASVTGFVDWARTRLGVVVEPADSAKAAVADARIICTTTASPVPILDSAPVSDGAHINAVGSSFRDRRELSTELVSRATLFVDSRASALAEAGELVIPVAEGRLTPEHIRAEVGELLLGRHPGRGRPDEVTVFKSLGLAVEDVLSGFDVERRAREQGIGRQIDLFDSGQPTAGQR